MTSSTVAENVTIWQVICQKNPLNSPQKNLEKFTVCTFLSALPGWAHRQPRPREAIIVQTLKLRNGSKIKRDNNDSIALNKKEKNFDEKRMSFVPVWTWKRLKDWDRCSECWASTKEPRNFSRTPQKPAEPTGTKRRWRTFNLWENDRCFCYRESNYARVSTHTTTEMNMKNQYLSQYFVLLPNKCTYQLQRGLSLYTY